jgi:multidrug efflux pump
MSLGTLLTIFVVPTMYALFARKKIPGANQAEAKELPGMPHKAEMIAK